MQALGPEFDEFVTVNSPGLLRTAFRLTGDRGHADDLLQAALLRTARRWGTARDYPLAYTRRVLVNLAKDRWRHRARRVTEVELGEADRVVTQPPDERLLTRDALLRATARLPARQRAVLVLRYFDQLSVEETAATLGCSAGNVKAQTHRALQRLRELLTDDKLTNYEENLC